MSLQFLVGTGAQDHQAAFVSHAKDWLEKSSANEVYFLVPNYNKFEQEKDILSALRDESESKIFSTTRTQVFSFRRFAWFMLQQNADYPKNSLSDSGAAMIFRKVLLDNRDELTVLRGEISKTGFIQQLYTLYKELLEGNITADDFAAALHQGTSDVDQQLKLKDLSLIFSCFEAEMLNQPLQTADYLKQLENQLADKNLSNLLFIVTGFSRLSAREVQLLAILMQQGNLEVSLLLDSKALQQELNPLDLFYDSQTSYLKLKNIANQAGVPVFFDQHAQPGQKPDILRDLLTYWEESQSRQTIHTKKIGVNPHLQIIKAETPKEELSWVARTIRRKVLREGLRYKDIQLLVRDMDCYGPLIPTIFKQNEVPYYLDQKSAMAQHPLVELLNALFALKNYHYRLADIIRFLRTELFLPDTGEDWQRARDDFRHKVDITENVALAYNFQGNYWVQDKDWQIIRYDFEDSKMEDTSDIQQISNDVRRVFQQCVPMFFDKVEQAKTGQEVVQALYEFLIGAGVETQLLAWRDQEILRGNLEVARNHEQTWNALISLLDEYVVIYGEADFDWEIFQDILKTGMENLTYGMIPTALDQVQVNNLELARPDQAKITFAIGLNDQVFPAKVETKGLLSSEDKQLLNNLLDDGKYLIDENTQGMNREPFYAYLTFLSGEQEVHLSYAANYDTQKDIQISPYLQRIHRYLGVPIDCAESLKLGDNTLERISTYRELLGDLNLVVRLAEENHQLVPASWQYFERLLKDSEWHQLTDRVLASLTDLNVPVSLSEEFVQSLYGTDIYASVSRLESFYNCGFKYFVTYGLRLKERQIYGLTPAATGDFYHEALDKFIKALLAQGLSLVEMTVEQREQLTDLVLQDIFGEPRFDILTSSARMNYIRYQLSQTIQKVSWALQQQSHRTSLKPARTEVLFGQIGGEKGIPGIELSLDNGGKLHVRGKIDRIDHMTVEDKTWLSVVDYKSSGRSFDVTEAYYGLAMQLITYLDVALTDLLLLPNAKKVHPAGAYYLHVQNPILTSNQNIEKETLKKFKYDGLFIDNQEVFETLDHSLEAKDSSQLFPIRMDKNAAYQKASRSDEKFYTEEELELLRKHNRRNMKKAGNDILSGTIDLNPAYKDKSRIACNFCPFRSVCTFDVMLKENQYHRIENLSKAKVMEKLQEGGDENA